MSISEYHNALLDNDKSICETLQICIDQVLKHAESKLWHAHPVWFLDGNPIVGYSKQKTGIRLMFWSGADFEEPGLQWQGKKFKDASTIYTHPDQIHTETLNHWLNQSIICQWDYKNLVKNKGILHKLNPVIPN